MYDAYDVSVFADARLVQTDRCLLPRVCWDNCTEMGGLKSSSTLFCVFSEFMESILCVTFNLYSWLIFSPFPLPSAIRTTEHRYWIDLNRSMPCTPCSVPQCYDMLRQFPHLNQSESVWILEIFSERWFLVQSKLHAVDAVHLEWDAKAWPLSAEHPVVGHLNEL